MKMKPIVDNKLWNSVEPVIPPKESASGRGRQPIPDRAALNGILFVLKTGIPFSGLPTEVGAGSGLSCWRRLREWQNNGTWAKLQRVLKKTPRLSGLDMSRFDESHHRTQLPVPLQPVGKANKTTVRKTTVSRVRTAR